MSDPRKRECDGGDVPGAIATPDISVHLARRLAHHAPPPVVPESLLRRPPCTGKSKNFPPGRFDISIATRCRAEPAVGARAEALAPTESAFTTRARCPGSPRRCPTSPPVLENARRGAGSQPTRATVASRQ